MRITRLELTNFRTFSHLVLEDIPEAVVLISPNGLGKSTILEAIAGTHDLVQPYHQRDYGIRETWENTSAPVWPPHLAAPVRIGAKKATIRITVEPNETEALFLEQKGISDPPPALQVDIEGGRFVTSLSATPSIKALYAYHTLADGIGFVDYTRAVRFHSRLSADNFAAQVSDDQTKHRLTEFQAGWGQQQKFSSFKGFIVATSLNDLTLSRQAGHDVDSLAGFRDVFDCFFAPKRFLGVKTLAGQPTAIAVETPWGEHDTDDLSDGEKEVLQMLAHLFRFRDLENVVLWDTPELHLNAALEARLYSAVRELAPRNQYWIATHSLEFINQVPLESLLVIRPGTDGAQIERLDAPEKKARVAVYRELGAQIGLQLVSSVVVFVEGKDSNSDKRILDRLVGSAAPFANFVAGGDCETVLAAGSRANRLLEASTTNGDFLAVVDRDYRTDEEVAQVQDKYGARVFVWQVHEIENVFLDPHLVFETLRFVGDAEQLSDVESVRAALHRSATALREWIAADWVAWDVHHAMLPPSRRISGEQPRASLERYLERLGEKTEALTKAGSLDKLVGARLQDVDRLLATDRWVARLPGKQMLKRFLADHTRLTRDAYLGTAVGFVRERKMELREIERLKRAIHSALDNAPRT